MCFLTTLSFSPGGKYKIKTFMHCYFFYTGLFTLIFPSLTKLSWQLFTTYSQNPWLYTPNESIDGWKLLADGQVVRPTLKRRRNALPSKINPLDYSAD